MPEEHAKRPLLEKMKHVYFATENVVLMSLLGVMGLVLFAQVVFRYVFQTPLLWSEELARYLQVWISFLGIGFGIRYSSHISMTILYKRFSANMQLVSGILIDLVLLVCFILVLPEAVGFTEYQKNINSSALGIPMNMVVVVFPIASAVFILHAIRNIAGKTLALIKNTKKGNV